jgi:putative two-component system response regulator
MSYFRNVLPMIRSHHERLDGSGYPDGLQGSQIPLLVRILQIVDICDALTANRAYRVSLSLSQALITLYEEADRGWLDEELVGSFASFVIGSQRVGAIDRKSRVLSVEPRKKTRSIGILGQISA